MKHKVKLTFAVKIRSRFKCAIPFTQAERKREMNGRKSEYINTESKIKLPGGGY